MSGNNPLLEALPPATDYITFLTIIEYNLSVENLPILYGILQDVELVSNIGWDLVHLLLPLLPDSADCLTLIARLGNPREVVLKVTECLRAIEFVKTHDENEEDDSTEHVDNSVGHDVNHDTSLSTSQFVFLLSMLSILHLRIKTQLPSRFLSTSLEAILSAFCKSVANREELVTAIVTFVKSISPHARPSLPARRSSALMNVSSSKVEDKEQQKDKIDAKGSPDELDLQKRLLQSFTTFVLDDYMVNLRSDDDSPGLSWATRIDEKMHPERVVPGRVSVSQRYIDDHNLSQRSVATSDLVALSRDLQITNEELLQVATKLTDTADLNSDADADADADDDLPKSAADVALCKTGSLLLYTARITQKVLFDQTSPESLLSIFPDHNELLMSFVDTVGNGAGSESEAVLDSLLALALLAIESNKVGQPEGETTFGSYLRTMSLVSSNCPSPSLRYIAFYVTTTILRSNPSPMERLAFIRNTLEHCPHDNLRVAAISWIKGETIEANPPTSSSSPPNTTFPSLSQSDDSESSIFSSPLALSTLSPYLFPDIKHDLTQPSMIQTWHILDNNLQFYLSVLNFYFLLLTAVHIRDRLDIKALHNDNDIGGSFLGPLGEFVKKCKDEAGLQGELGKQWIAEKTGGLGNEEYVDGEKAKLELLEDALTRVRKGVERMNGALP